MFKFLILPKENNKQKMFFASPTDFMQPVLLWPNKHETQIIYTNVLHFNGQLSKFVYDFFLYTHNLTKEHCQEKN